MKMPANDMMTMVKGSRLGRTGGRWARVVALAAMGLLGCASSAQAGDTIIFVNASAAPGGNGSSWATAFQSLSAGLNAAGIVSPQASQVWVAQGTYTVPAASTFFIPLGAEVYGGFAGGETSINQRDPETNITVISGDVLNNSTPTGVNTSDDAGILIGINQTDARAVTQVLDGFTVQYARTTLLDVFGGAKPRVQNCTFQYVFGGGAAGVSGVRIQNGSPTVFARNTIHTVVGASATTPGSNGATGSTGTNGANGGNGTTPSNGGVGGAGGNGQAGGPGLNGAPAFGVHLFGGSASAIVGNRIHSIFGGDGAPGGNGGAGGQGGNGGNGGNHTSGGPAGFGNNGGRGGNGGTGGAGGSGGFAAGILYDAASVSPLAIANNVIYNLLPGDGGFPGAAGPGGRGGNGGQGGSSTGQGGAGGNAGSGGTGGIGGLGGGAGAAIAFGISSAQSPVNLHSNTADVSRNSIAGPPGSGGAGGAPGTPGLGGSGSPAGNNGTSGSTGAAGASGDNGTTPATIGVSTTVSGTSTVSVYNSVFRLGSGADVNVFLGQVLGAPIFFDHSIATTVVSSGNVTLGTRMLSADPNFYNLSGLDGISGTDDDDYSLRTPSLALDAGSNSLIPADVADLDGDLNTTEPLPFDFAGNPRRADVPGVFDQGTPPVVDMGAIEADPAPPMVAFFEPDSPSYSTSPAQFVLIFDRPVSAVPFGLVSVNVTGDVNVTNLSIDRINDQVFFITAGFTSNTGGSIAAVISDNDTILSQVGIPLNGPGTGNVTSTAATIFGGGGGNPPAVSQTFISGAGIAPPNSTKQFGFEFSEAVTGVDSDDFQMFSNGLTGAVINGIFSIDDVTWTVEVFTGTTTVGGSGSITIRLTDNNTITSISSGEPLDGPGTGATFDSPTLIVSGAPDCNQNGVPDSTDISGGTSQDCNSNGVPDECDIAGYLADQSFGPIPYLSEADSPFSFSGLGTTVFLETFEDGSLNTPGVTAAGTSVCGCGGFNDSVDGDDGSIDGFGTNGSSLFAGDGTTGVLFTFDSGPFGRLPQLAGVVFTDGGINGTVTFEARDGSGQIIGTFPSHTADGTNFGTTAEDRFYGIVHAAGISSIRIRCTGGGLEVDHLQYGVFTGTSQDANGNGIPDECEGPGSDSNYTVDESWRMNPFEPPAGWNTSLNFDDSDNAGWGVPVVIEPQPAPLGNGVWSFPGTSGGSSQTFLRKKVRLLAPPAPGEALLKVIADDDADVYVNGVQVILDSDCSGGTLLSNDVSNLLTAGENLIAVEATDCFCCGRFVAVSLQVDGNITDCNNNGVPDRTEIASAAVPDGNGNGVPDPCEGLLESLAPYPFDLQRAVNTPLLVGAASDRRVRSADLNGDNLPDLYAAIGTAAVSLRGGPGELMFFNPTLPGAGGTLFDAVAADFNLDGRVDVAFASQGGIALYVYRNTGNSPISYTVDSTGGSAAAAFQRLALINFNGDARPDLLGIDANGDVRVFVNGSAQGGPVLFAALDLDIPNLTRGGGGIDILVRDIDTDGREDFVALFGGYAVMLSNGGGFSEGRVVTSDTFSSIALANPDGFGGIKLVRSSVSGVTDVVTPLLNDPAYAVSVSGLRSMTVGDIDQDGFDDLAAVSSTGGLMWLTFDDSFGFIEKRISVVGDAQTVALVDIDPDGDLDLVTYQDFTVSNRPDGEGEEGESEERSTQSSFRIIPSRVPHRDADIFGISQVAGFGDAPTATVTADINGDGRDDLLGASFFDDAVNWWDYVGFDSEGWDKTPVAAAGISPRADGPSAVAAADIDGDGDTDVISAGILNNTVLWYSNLGGAGEAWSNNLVDSSATGVSCLDVADVDGNGAPDIVAGLSTGAVRVYLTRRSQGLLPTFDVVNIAGGGGAIRTVAAVDIDRDGLMDIVAGDYGTGQIRVFAQQGPSATTGDGPFFTPLPALPNSTPTAVIVRDFTGDGRADILATSFAQNSVTLRPGTGPRTFGAANIIATGVQGASALTAGDYDLDGDLDFAVAGRQANDLFRGENTGSGAFSLFSCFTSIEGASALASGDFDRDGKGDLLASTFTGDKFLWVQNNASSLYAFATGTLSAMTEGSTAAVARVNVEHRGNSGDVDFAFVRFNAFFQDRAFSLPGQPSPVSLTPAQLNAIISRIEVRIDLNRNGVFDTGEPLLGSANAPFTFNGAGFQTLSFPLPGADKDNKIEPGENLDYIIVVQTTGNASSQSPNTFSLLIEVSEETIVDTRFRAGVKPRFSGFYSSSTVSIGPDFRPSCPTDIDENGRTDTSDLIAFLGSFGNSLQPFTRGDVNGDGRVTTADLIRMLSNFGLECR